MCAIEAQHSNENCSTVESFEDIPTENISMHIFISFFSIIRQIAELSYFAFRTMEWTEDHDVLLIQEIVARDLFSFQKGSVARGEWWESIAETLNEVKTLSFHFKVKRAVRDRWILLQKKYKAKMHQEETASGISVDKMPEIDVLLEELVGKEKSLNKVGDAQSRKLKEDKSKADDIRQKALERYSEMKSTSQQRMAMNAMRNPSAKGEVLTPNH